MAYHYLYTITMNFKDLQLIEPIANAIEEEGYTTPTPIQEQAIPILLQGFDLLGCAQTGTGKTAAFAIPILQLLHQGRQHEGKRRVLTTLILTPTRELAIQIGESFAAYGRHTGLKHTVIFGGVSQHSQVKALDESVNVLIATPGRLLDLIQQGIFNLNQIRIFVLDEADRMLDMGFIHDVKKVIKLLPPKRQNLFFSATMPPTIVDLADSILQNPKKVEVTPANSTVDIIEQQVYFVDKTNKKNLLIDVLQNYKNISALMFARTKHGADRISKDLNRKNIKAASIHGDKSQNARQRALQDFKENRIQILVATDIAARGIDIDGLSLVINYDIPNVPETYVHRIGRTGRAGSSGMAISFADIEEKDFIKDIEKLINKKIPVVAEHNYPMEVLDVNRKKAQAEANKQAHFASRSNGNNANANKKKFYKRK
jgi:ATP-dependent RNA helicase RhlE